LNRSYFIERKFCPACNSDKIKEIYSNKFTEEPIKSYLENFYNSQGVIQFEYLKNELYSLSNCLNCDLIFQRYIPNDNLMKIIYEEWIDPKKALSDNFNNNNLFYSYYSMEIMRIIAFLKKPSSTLKIFDFGIGWGKWALMAKAFGCDAYGSELSEERINYGKKWD